MNSMGIGGSGRHGPRGLFVTFDGCEGSGKTTQVELLRKYLVSIGQEVVVTREPGGTLLGQKIREILLDPAYKEVSPRTEALLFAADRAQEVEQVIKPAISKGRVVLADRFIDSSLAYQGVARGLGLEAVRNLNEWATDDIEPDLTFILDVPRETSLERKSGSAPDRIESEPYEFHDNVRQAYLSLAAIFPNRIVVIDGRASEAVIHRQVVGEVSRLL